MSEVDSQPPFTPPDLAIERIGYNLNALELRPDSCQVVGSTALLAAGYVRWPGRMDVIVGDEDYARLARRRSVITAAEPIGPGEDGINDMLIVDADTFGNKHPIHIINEWHPRSDLNAAVTYETMAEQTQEVRGIAVVNPLTSIKWLFARAIPKDGSAAFRGIMSLRAANPDMSQTLIDGLFQRAEILWPKPESAGSDR